MNRAPVFWIVWSLVTVAGIVWFSSMHPGRPPFSTPAAGGDGPDFVRHLRAIAGLAITLALAWPAGVLLFRGARREEDRIGAVAPPATAVLTGGVVILTHAAWALAAFDAFGRIALVAVALAPLAVVRPEALRPEFLRPGRGGLRARFRLRARPGGLVLLLPVALALGAIVIRSLAPATGNDAMVYHFAIARLVAETGGHTLPDANIYGHMPHLGSLGYSVAWLFGGEGAALLLRVAALAGLAATAARLGGAFAERAGDPARASDDRPGNGFAPLTIALVFAHPILLDPRTFGNVDLFGSLLFLLAAEQIVGRPGTTKGASLSAWSSMLPGGLFAGAMLGVKLSNAFLLPALLVLFLLRPAPRRVRGAVAFAGFALLPVIPWLVRNAIQSGHPLFPLVPGASQVWDPVLAEQLRSWQLSMGMGRSALDFVLLPFRVFFEGDRGYHRFDGTLNPLLLFMLVPALLFGSRPVRVAVLAGIAGLALWSLGPQQVRFLLPVVFLLTAAAGGGSVPPVGSGLRRLVIFVVAGASLAALAVPARDLLRDSAPVVIGTEDEETYRSRQLQSHVGLRMIERTVPEGDKVWFLWENRLYGFARPHLADSFFEASQNMRLAARAGSANALGAELARRNVRWVAVNRALERVFARLYPRSTYAVVEEYLGGLEPAGAWRGMELYRVPGARVPGAER